MTTETILKLVIAQPPTDQVWTILPRNGTPLRVFLWRTLHRSFRTTSATGLYFEIKIGVLMWRRAQISADRYPDRITSLEESNWKS